MGQNCAFLNLTTRLCSILTTGTLVKSDTGEIRDAWLAVSTPIYPEGVT